MNKPFSCYFVNSSHNTFVLPTWTHLFQKIQKIYWGSVIFRYLSGDQITSSSRPDSYVAAIMKGARLLESIIFTVDFADY